MNFSDGHLKPSRPFIIAAMQNPPVIISKLLLAFITTGSELASLSRRDTPMWLKGCCIGTANEGEFADIYALGWVSHLRTALAGIAVKLGMEDMDLSSLDPAEPRVLT